MTPLARKDPQLTPAAKVLASWPNSTRWLARALAKISDVVMPPVCLGCQCPMADHNTLCPDCWSDISFIRAPLCDRLGTPMPYDTGGVMVSAAAISNPPDYDRARAVAAYQGTMRRLIHDFKFRDDHTARAAFTRWLATAGGELLHETDLLVPVPLYRFRLLTRRFNQSAILANDLAKFTGRPANPTALLRIRPTKQQVGLTSEQRKHNVKGAFVVAKKALKLVNDRHITLIDDVITTGATVESCARALKTAGAKQVDVLTLAIATSPAHDGRSTA